MVPLRDQTYLSEHFLLAQSSQQHSSAAHSIVWTTWSQREHTLTVATHDNHQSNVSKMHNYTYIICTHLIIQVFSPGPFSTGGPLAISMSDVVLGACDLSPEELQQYHMRNS